MGKKPTKQNQPTGQVSILLFGMVKSVPRQTMPMQVILLYFCDEYKFCGADKSSFYGYFSFEGTPTACTSGKSYW